MSGFLFTSGGDVECEDDRVGFKTETISGTGYRVFPNPARTHDLELGAAMSENGVAK